MRLLVSWLRDFVDVTAPAEEIAERLCLCGFETAAVEPYGAEDAVIDLEVTANRPDCLGVVGLAREVATLYDRPITMPSSEAGARIALRSLPTGSSDRVEVTVADHELCPRYAAAIAEVTDASSPAWLTTRLHAVGIRPISAIVDLTNYVLIELGHPTHAFDLSTLAGPEIRVRRAKPGELLTTLDGVERSLDPEMLVIADRDRAQALAGVMGGALSEVSPATRVVVIESAYFKPASVRRTSKRLGLKTEASSRFERGADIEAPIVAIQRLAALMDQIGAGCVIGPIADVYPHRHDCRPLHLRRRRLKALLGAIVPDAEVERILRSLGLTVTASSDGWDVVAATFRVDVQREADLIEEVGRHFGFDRLEPIFPAVTAPVPPPDPRVSRDEQVRRVLTAAGLSEAVTFGFIEEKAATLCASSDEGPPVAIRNPLSAKYDTLRPTLIPGLLDAVAHNRSHQRDSVRLFEIGARFSQQGETRALGMALTGPSRLHWSGGERDVDFFDVKGVVELVCGVLGRRVRFEPTTQPFLVEGQAARVVADSESVVGVAGRLAPRVAEARGLPRQDPVYVAELDLDLLERAYVRASDAVRPLPRYPFVVRDLSIIVADTLRAEIIRGTIQAAGRRTPAPLSGLVFFDRYQGQGIPPGAVSLSVRLTFQADDRTLTDPEIHASVDAIMAALAGEHGAVQR